MDQIFAPWRIQWVERDDKNEDINGCVFCELPEQDNDQDNRIVARSDHSYVIMNISPYSPGHVLVIPHQHTSEYTALTDEVMLDHARLKQRTIDALEHSISPDYFNSGMNLGDEVSGGSVKEHIHTHIVPRWDEDKDMRPNSSDQDEIDQAIDELYTDLHASFSKQSNATKVDDDTAVHIEFD